MRISISISHPLLSRPTSHFPHPSLTPHGTWSVLQHITVLMISLSSTLPPRSHTMKTNKQGSVTELDSPYNILDKRTKHLLISGPLHDRFYRFPFLLRLSSSSVHIGEKVPFKLLAPLQDRALQLLALCYKQVSFYLPPLAKAHQLPFPSFSNNSVISV